MNTPNDKEIAFLFVSHPTKTLSWRWTARLVFPPGATASTPLKLFVTDGDGDKVPTGTFEFAGKKLPVSNGEATLTYAEFIQGKHDVALWLHRPGIAPIPGGLTFG